MAEKHHADHRGPSQRQLRVGELIRRSLSDIFARGDLHHPDLARTSITVGEVRTSPDLRHATVFVFPLAGAGSETVLAALDESRREIRREMTRDVTLKYSPELHFRLDETFDRMDETRRLLSQDSVRRDLEAQDSEDNEELS